MKLDTILSTCIVFVCVLSVTAASAGQIPVEDDTWVREDNADSNRNGDDQMNARTDIDAVFNDVIYLRFPATDLAAPASGATLNLYWQRSDSGTGNSLKLHGLNESHPGETTWDETTITYNNAPGLLPDGLPPLAETGLGNTDDDIQDLDTAHLTLLVDLQPYGPQVENEIYTFSGPGLDSFINADTNGEVTFLILRSLGTSGNQARFWPKESGPGAFLGNVSVIPEPGTAMLFLLALASFACRRSMPIC